MLLIGFQPEIGRNMKKLINEVVKDDGMTKLTLVVCEADKYTKKHYVSFVSEVYDEYHKEWLDPRTVSFFLTEDEIQRLSDALGIKDITCTPVKEKQ